MPPVPKYKYLSGAQNRKKKKLEEEKAKNDKGPHIHKFFSKLPQSSNSNMDEANVGEEGVNVNELNAGEDDVNANVDEGNVDEANVGETNLDEANVGEDNVNASVDEATVGEDDANANFIDIFDPRTWDGLTPNLINELVKKGPKRDLTIDKGSVDKHGRRFSKVMHMQGGLESEGYEDWKHASQALKEHEVSFEHLKNMNQWFEMRQRLECNETIDKVAYDQFKKERDYWKEAIFRIIALVKFLAKNGLAFRRSNEKLYKKSNGNLLGLVEMLEEFDPIMKDHMRRIMSNELHVHCIGHNIQNEFIQLLAHQIKTEVIKKMKLAKYYSIILDCTLDTSHKEQMSIIVRWQVLKENVKGLTLKSLSTTRWEIRVDSINPIRTQLVDVRKSLQQVRDSDKDPKIQSETKSLEKYEVGEFEFLVQIVLWYEILSNVNVVSKKLQSNDVVLDVAIDEVDKLINYFKDYREVGLFKAFDEAREIANEMGIDVGFPQKRVIHRKKQFDETSSVEEVTFSPEEDFKVNYFLRIADQAIVSLKTRFDQYQKFEKIFGFLFPEKLKTLDEKYL
ncbi:uncharacterized protein LOC143575950 [Bidens hawaiensis]|uniref:uncharacterized protein LOC143575950 n=1 Tax=Bidens hawaiensis TaxID=980011 RepID=UPI00404933A0